MPNRLIYPNDDLKFENFCSKVKNLYEIFLENYYFTMKWSENENFYSLNCLEKYFMMLFILINHCFEEKFLNKTHYYDFHSRFNEFNEIADFFYNIVSINLKFFLKTLIYQINLILNKDIHLKSKACFQIAKFMLELENESNLKINGYLLTYFNQSLRNFLIMSSVSKRLI